VQKSDRIELYKQALKEWGPNAQCMMSIEEAAELLIEISNLVGNFIKRLCKLWRAKKGQSYEKQKTLLQYEIADMDIMVEQLKLIFGEEEIEECKNKKLERLKSRL
jgi:hypothetical protein